MPHATMTLIPGIDTNETLALNQAAFSSSQLIRFIADRSGKGLVQKLGGWVNWYGSASGQTPIQGINELHAWEDLNNNARLAVGATNSLSYIGQSNRTNFPITPETTSGDSIATSSQTVTINIGTSVFTPASSVPINGTPVTFTTTVALPTGLSVGTVYYVINATSTTYQVSGSINGSAVSLSGTQSGVQTVSIPVASTVQGSTTVTIYDVGTGVQSVTFASNTVTIGNQASGVAGVSPVVGSQVIFTGASLPSGVSANTAYYVISTTSTTYKISATSGGSSLSFGSGSGTQYSSTTTQMFIQAGYSVNLLTPISISNFILSGVYNIVSISSGSYYNIYTINSGVVATTTTATATLPTFTTTQNFNYVTVNQNFNSYIGQQTVAFLVSTVVSNFTIYGNYIVQTTPTPTSTSYNIIGSGSASSTATVTMNNGYARFQYYFNIPSTSSGGGYGTGQYGYGGYGQGLPLTLFQTNTISNIADWTINNFGEILVASPQFTTTGGPIYYWSPTNNTYTSYLLNTAPLVNQGIFIAMPARQVVAYGSTVTGIQDPLLIRWSDAADATNWIASANNQAGSYRIPEGSLIVGALQGPQQALIWTDVAVWAMQYVGLPNVYGFNKLGDGAGLIGKKAAGILNNVVYWMSSQKFMMLSGGGPQTIQCPIWDIIFQNINNGTLSNGQPAYSLIRCATNSTFGEVGWFYPSTNATVNDSYVKYNINTQQWDYGSLDRTAWTDQSVLGTPIGSSSNGVIYQHEIGYNAGSSPMLSSVQTGYIQLNEADNLIFIDQIWPDFKWTTAGGGTGGSTTSGTGSNPTTLYVTFYGTDYPGDTPTKYGPYTVTQSTEYISTRIRNRLLSIAISTSPDGTTGQLNSFFRIGALRYRFQLDGKF